MESMAHRNWIEYDIVNGQPVVIKYYHNKCKEFLTELKILSTLKHPNLLSAIDTFTNLKGNIGIILPAEADDLANFLDYNNPVLSLDDKFYFLIQIAVGLEHLHQLRIIHMDLKLENILITDDHIKIADFGSAEYIIDNKAFTTKMKCTATHRPPEGFEIYLEPDQKIFVFDLGFDIWSFGIVMYEILSGVPIYFQGIFPTCDKTTYDDLKLVEEFENQIFPIIITADFRNKICEVLGNSYIECLNIESESRPTISDVLQMLENE